MCTCIKDPMRSNMRCHNHISQHAESSQANSPAARLLGHIEQGTIYSALQSLGPHHHQGFATIYTSAMMPVYRKLILEAERAR